MDRTKPHLRQFFKTVPMRDEDGNRIPNNPPIKHGGPWEKPEPGIKIGKDLNKTKGSEE